MIVVSDTSPICYLVLIDAIEVLSELYGEVIIPQAVYDELSASGSPSVLARWIKSPPNWLKIESVAMFADESLKNLDTGECEAILLAENLEANLIILDEREARKIAEHRGLNVIGLLGILYQAALQDLIDLVIMIERLKKTNFRASSNLLDSLLEHYRQEK